VAIRVVHVARRPCSVAAHTLSLERARQGALSCVLAAGLSDFDDGLRFPVALVSLHEAFEVVGKPSEEGVAELRVAALQIFIRGLVPCKQILMIPEEPEHEDSEEDGQREQHHGPHLGRRHLQLAVFLPVLQLIGANVDAREDDALEDEDGQSPDEDYKVLVVPLADARA